ncbi:VWA domain-containing protein [Parashewanella curva]|uniref:VWA domain-containing protein n=1 Tax=Parashewanella curva TaxID=2338552 RepID=A0A3L8PY24_9GAMM|nr:VWA domain-containing protein [Parashewanella curva]RLV60357.1 VWA domain-containing protein [Parashewanella curva]
MTLHFIRPEWLFALIPLAMVLVLLWRQQGGNTVWNRYISPHLATLLIDTGAQNNKNSVLLLSGFWLILVIALSGPAVTKQNLPVFASTQGRVLLMDMSLSTYATDLPPNRLTQERYKAIDLIKALNEGETGLIAYAGDAFTISPLTRDKGTLLNFLPTLTPDIMPVAGSNLASGIDKAKQLLTHGGHIKGDIIVFTDGINEKQLQQAKAQLDDQNFRLIILAFGSKQGAPIRLPDGQLLRDNANQVVVAKTRYDLLSELAQAGQGSMIQYRADDNDIKQITNQLSVKKQAKLTDLQGETWQDLGPYIALLLTPFVLMLFRNGATLFTLILCAGLLMPQPVKAMDWNSLWKTQNQQAQEAYNNKEYQQAAKQFNQPQWQHSAQYKAGDFKQALKGFEQDNSATGLYNQGNTLMQMGNYAEAEKRYQQALKQAPSMADAQHNLELAKKLQKQQQQKKQNSSGDNKQQNQDKKDQQPQQNDQQNNKNSDEQKSQQKQNQQQQSNQNQESDQQKQSANDSQQSDEQNNKPQQQNQQTNQNDQKQKQSEQKQQKSKSEQPKADKQKSKKQQATAAEQKQDNGEPKQQLPASMQRALNAIPDDPQLLIRNKMQLEYQKRRQQGRTVEGQEQW